MLISHNDGVGCASSVRDGDVRACACHASSVRVSDAVLFYFSTGNASLGALPSFSVFFFLRCSSSRKCASVSVHSKMLDRRQRQPSHCGDGEGTAERSHRGAFVSRMRTCSGAPRSFTRTPVSPRSHQDGIGGNKNSNNSSSRSSKNTCADLALEARNEQGCASVTDQGTPMQERAAPPAATAASVLSRHAIASGAPMRSGAVVTGKAETR